MGLRSGDSCALRPPGAACARAMPALLPNIHYRIAARHPVLRRGIIAAVTATSGHA
jgi:hypothetical protein